jgi:hypothetical protein
MTPPGKLLPDILDKNVHKNVARAVMDASRA